MDVVGTGLRSFGDGLREPAGPPASMLEMISVRPRVADAGIPFKATFPVAPPTHALR